MHHSMQQNYVSWPLNIYEKRNRQQAGGTQLQSLDEPLDWNFLTREPDLDLLLLPTISRSNETPHILEVS